MNYVQTVTAMTAPKPTAPTKTDTLRFEYLPNQSQTGHTPHIPALRRHSPSSGLSPSDFRAYNRVAELMELYVSFFNFITFMILHPCASASAAPVSFDFAFDRKNSTG